MKFRTSCVILILISEFDIYWFDLITFRNLRKKARACLNIILLTNSIKQPYYIGESGVTLRCSNVILIDLSLKSLDTKYLRRNDASYIRYLG